FGWSVIFAFAGYGDEWPYCRRLLHQTFCPDSAPKFRPMQIKRAHEMIVNLIDDPHCHFATSVYVFLTSIMMSATYGRQTSLRDDPLVGIVENAVALALQAMTPERAILLKIFPFCELSYFSRVFNQTRCSQTSANCMREMTDVLFQYVQEHMVGIFRFERYYYYCYSEFIIFLQGMVYLSLIHIYSGSYETTISVLMVFALAMVSYPNVQKRAQVEIDSVVGQDRLPTFEDRVSLPYVESILRETLRWQPTGPIAPPATSSDDIYDGYFIPKGLPFLSSEQITSNPDCSTVRNGQSLCSRKRNLPCTGSTSR
ncbi:cytochrome P450, partial [Suillus plorans]